MLGINAKLYRNTGTYGSATWTEVSEISDLAVNPAWDEADASSRGSRVKSTVKTLLAIELTGKVRKKAGNDNVTAIVNALHTDDSLDVLVLDGDKATEGVRGYRMDVQVFAANEDQAMANAIYLDVTMKPNDYTNPVKAVLVGAEGALSFAIPGPNGDTFA